MCIQCLNAARQGCPWLNAATAAGALEGPVDVTVTKDGSDATCEFTRRNSPEKLQIVVVTMGTSRGELAAFKAQCAGTVTPLKAIGTDAVACSFEAKNGENAEQVAGRVRKQAFLIRVSAKLSVPREMLREKAAKVAEQVAGNLF